MLHQLLSEVICHEWVHQFSPQIRLRQIHPRLPEHPILLLEEPVTAAQLPQLHHLARHHAGLPTRLDALDTHLVPHGAGMESEVLHHLHDHDPRLTAPHHTHNTPPNPAPQPTRSDIPPPRNRPQRSQQPDGTTPETHSTRHKTLNTRIDHNVARAKWPSKVQPLKRRKSAERNIGLTGSERSRPQIHNRGLVTGPLRLVDGHRPRQPQWILGELSDNIPFQLLGPSIPAVSKPLPGHRFDGVLNTVDRDLHVVTKNRHFAERAIDPALLICSTHGIVAKKHHLSANF